VSVTGESTPALDVQFIPSDAPVLELEARNTDDGVLVSWSTAESFAAFNLYRVGPRGTSVGDRLNERPLPAAARSYLDLSTGSETRRYRLEAVNAAGHRMVFGPVEIVPENDTARLSLACYPQPARTAVTVEFTANDEPAALSVYDLAGRLVERRELGALAGRSSLTLDVADYDGGVYLLSLEVGAERLTRRLVVSR
ncbi:MAG: T9SS type A sorting domain-containing protein, partial [Candidatus Coatesbacteria bacterium]|nr:T9SS type A sorting domain-containing protein [Candidatus Coatesbacteria bacterium]